jgi:hypothetical protein
MKSGKNAEIGLLFFSSRILSSLHESERERERNRERDVFPGASNDQLPQHQCM